MTANLTNETRLERVFVFLAYPLLVSMAEKSFLPPAVHTDTTVALTSLHQHKQYSASLTRWIRQVFHILMVSQRQQVRLVVIPDNSLEPCSRLDGEFRCAGPFTQIGREYGSAIYTARPSAQTVHSHG